MIGLASRQPFGKLVKLLRAIRKPVPGTGAALGKPIRGVGAVSQAQPPQHPIQLFLPRRRR